MLKSLDSISTLAIFLASIAAVEAVPAVSLVFGPSDQATVIAAVLIVAAVAVFSKFVDGSTYGAGHMMSHEDHHDVRDKLKSNGCGFFAWPGWALYLTKFVGYLALSIALGPYILHVFEDAGGANIVPAPPATFNTWFTWIWVTAVAGAVFDKLAADFHHAMQWNMLALVASVISWAGFVASLVFLIMEFVQLPAGTQVQWETFLTVVVSIWILVSTIFTIRYGLILFYTEGYKQL